MVEVTFVLFRKLMCVALVFSLLWPDIAKCMDDEEENVPQQKHLSLPIYLLQENLVGQKGNKPPSENPKEDANNPPLSETNNVSEDNDENSSTLLLLTEESFTETNVTSTEGKISEENPSENKISVGDHTDPSPELKDKEDIDEINTPLKNPSLEEEEDGDLYSDNSTLIIEEKEEIFSEKTKAFLTYFKKRIIDGWPTGKQVVLGAIGGTVLGIAVGVGMLIIIDGEIRQPAEIGIPFFDKLWNALFCSNKTTCIWIDVTDSYYKPNNVWYTLLAAVGVTSGLDAIMRGSSSLMSIFDDVGQDSFLLSRKTYKKRLNIFKTLSYAISFFSSILPVYYLLVSSSIFTYLNSKPKYSDPTSQLLETWLILSFPQILDTMFAYGKSLSNTAEKWCRKKAFQKHQRILPLNSEEKEIEAQRQNYLELLKKLEWILYNKLPNKKIQQLYEEIFQKKNSEEISEALKTLKDLETLLKVYESYEGENPIPSQQAKKKQASIFGWIIAGLASPARHYVFWKIVSSMNSFLMIYKQHNKLFNLKIPTYIIWPVAVIFGGIFGAGTQGWIEKENLKKVIWT